MIDLETLYRTDPVKACRLALQRTRNVKRTDRLEAIDKLLKAFGVEAIRGEWQNGYWCDIVASYCNTGDTYALTVIHIRGDNSWNEQGRFIVSSHFIEKSLLARCRQRDRTISSSFRSSALLDLKPSCV